MWNEVKRKEWKGISLAFVDDSPVCGMWLCVCTLMLCEVSEFPLVPGLFDFGIGVPEFGGGLHHRSLADSPQRVAAKEEAKERQRQSHAPR